MERYFRLEDGTVVDIVDECIKQISIHNNLKIYIATDSQNRTKRRKVIYATVVVFRYGTRGAHCCFRIDEQPMIRDVYKRLFQEGELTINTAQMITEEIPVKIEALEFDYAGIKKTLSSPLVSGVGGWAAGLGYNAVFKGGEMIASKAADHYCRRKKK